MRWGKSGYSLVELCVGLVLFGFATCLLLNGFVGSARAGVALERSRDYADLLDKVRRVLSSRTLCRCNLTPSSQTRNFMTTRASQTTFELSDLKLYDDACSPHGSLVSQAAASELSISKIELKDFFNVDSRHYLARLGVEVFWSSSPTGSMTVAHEFTLLLDTITVLGTVHLMDCSPDYQVGTTFVTAPMNTIFSGKTCSSVSGNPSSTTVYTGYTTCPSTHPFMITGGASCPAPTGGTSSGLLLKSHPRGTQKGWEATCCGTDAGTVVSLCAKK